MRVVVRTSGSSGSKPDCISKPRGSASVQRCFTSDRGRRSRFQSRPSPQTEGGSIVRPGLLEEVCLSAVDKKTAWPETRTYEDTSSCTLAWAVGQKFSGRHWTFQSRTCARASYPEVHRRDSGRRAWPKDSSKDTRSALLDTSTAVKDSRRHMQA